MKRLGACNLAKLVFAALLSLEPLLLTQTNGQDISLPQVLQLNVCSPTSSPVTGGTVISCLGAGYNESMGSARSRCAFTYIDQQSTGGQILLSKIFEIYDGGSRMECTVPDMSSFGVSPFGLITVHITGGAASGNSRRLPFTIFDLSAISVRGIQPGEASTNSSSVISVAGVNFTNTGNVSCRVDNTSLAARFVNTSLLECTVPAVSSSYLTHLDVWLNGDATGLVNATNEVATRLTYVYTAPSVRAVHFLDSYAALELALDRPCEIGGENETQYNGGLNVSCDAVFSPLSLASIGAGGKCLWTSQEQIAVRILLPPNSTVSVGDVLTVSPTSGVGLRTRYQKFSRLTTGTVSVQPALAAAAAPTPNIVIHGASTVPVCGDIGLDLSLSTGGGGRRLDFSWAVTTHSTAPAVANGTTLLASGSSSAIRLQSSWLTNVTQSPVSLTVNASNFAGQSTTSVLQLTLSGSSNEAISSLAKVTFRADNFVLLECRLERQQCADSSLLFNPVWNSGDAAFVARLSPRNGTTALVTTSGLTGDVFPSSLSVATRSRRGGSTIVTSVVNLDNVSLTPAYLTASIGGGVERVASVLSSITLDACTSSDPDQRDIQLANLNWSCTTEETMATCMDLLASGPFQQPSDMCSLALDPRQLSVNQTHTFKVTVSKPGRGSSTAQCRVKILDAADATAVHADTPLYWSSLDVEDFIHVEGYVTTNSPTNVTWGCVNNITGFGYVDVEGDSATLLASQYRYQIVSNSSMSSSLDAAIQSSVPPSQERRKFSLVFRPGVLTPGLSYRLRLRAGLASADVDIRTGLAPFGGRLVVAYNRSLPLLALTHYVVLTTDGWSDSPSNYPFRYRFGYQSAATAAGIPAEIHWWTPLIGFNSLSCVLPLLNTSNTDNEITIWAEAANNFGSSSRISQRVTVRTPTTNSVVLGVRLTEDRQRLDGLQDWAGATANVQSVLGSKTGISFSIQQRDVLAGTLLDVAQYHLPDIKPYRAWIVSIFRRLLRLGNLGDAWRAKIVEYMLAVPASILQPSWLAPLATDPRRLRNSFGLQRYRRLSVEEATALLDSFAMATASLTAFRTTAQVKGMITFVQQIGLAVGRGLAIHQQSADILSSPAVALRVARTIPPTGLHTAGCSQRTNCSSAFPSLASLQFTSATAQAFESYRCGMQNSDRCHGVVMVTSQFRSLPLQMPTIYSSPTRSDVVMVVLQDPTSGAELQATVNVSVRVHSTSALSSAAGVLQCQRFVASTGRWTTDGCQTVDESSAVASHSSGKLWTCRCAVPTASLVVGLFERCPDGYYGNQCSTACPRNRLYGYECKDTCRCVAGQGECNRATGECACHDGWQGDTCATSCSMGFYGSGCRSRCLCQNGALCYHVDGSCACLPGWTGSLCDTECPSSTFGAGCASPCLCQNNATCNHVNGSCNCTAGFMGTTCQSQCPEATFGLGCSSNCLCNTVGSTRCHHVTGNCTCVTGYSGAMCEIPPPVPPSPNLAWVAAIAVVILVLVAVVVFLLWYKKKKRSMRVGFEEMDEQSNGKESRQGWVQRVRRIFRLGDDSRADDQAPDEGDNMSGNESDIEMTRTTSRREVMILAEGQDKQAGHVLTPGETSERKLLIGEDAEDVDKIPGHISTNEEKDRLDNQPAVAGRYSVSNATKSPSDSADGKKPKGGRHGEGSHCSGSRSQLTDGTDATGEETESYDSEEDDRSDNPDFCICSKEGEFECECTLQAYCSEECQQSDWARHSRYCTLVDSEISGSGESGSENEEDGSGEDADKLGEDVFVDKPTEVQAPLSPKLSDTHVPDVKKHSIRRTLSEAVQPTTMTLYVDRKISGQEMDAAAVSTASMQQAWREHEEEKARREAAAQKSASSIAKKDGGGLLDVEGEGDPNNPLFSRSFHAETADADTLKKPKEERMEVDEISEDDFNSELV